MAYLLAEYESFYNGHRPHRSPGQAAPLRPFPDNAVDLDALRIARHDRIGGILHEYRLPFPPLVSAQKGVAATRGDGDMPYGVSGVRR
ncbi:hypothetical protein ABH926_005160 [Catenulispora sp. GP43]